MNTEVHDVYTEYSRKLWDDSENPSNDGEKERLRKYAKMAANIAEAVTTDKFQNPVLKQCCLLFGNGDFNKLKDEKTTLFCCENGVMDLDMLMVREGRHDDNITISCGICYEEFSEEDEDVIEFDKIIERIFVDKKIRDYFYATTCLCLKGGNENKLFVTGIGNGDNAKSFVNELIRVTFGDYCIQFPREMFIVGCGNSSGSARPELARVRGKRIGMVKEFTKKDKLNVGAVKEATGNDCVYARTLYEKGHDLKPQYTLLGHLNSFPQIPSDDYAMWDRMKFIPYQSKFVISKNLSKYPVPKTHEEQMKMKRFHADLTLSDRIVEFAPIFLWRLFKKFKEIKLHGFKEPKEVTAATLEQQSKSDPISKFGTEKIFKSSEEFVGVMELFRTFKSWWRESYPTYKMEFCKDEFIDQLSKKLGSEPVKVGRVMGWEGYEMAKDEDENPSTNGGESTAFTQRRAITAN